MKKDMVRFADCPLAPAGPATHVMVFMCISFTRHLTTSMKGQLFEHERVFSFRQKASDALLFMCIPPRRKPHRGRTLPSLSYT